MKKTILDSEVNHFLKETIISTNLHDTLIRWSMIKYLLSELEATPITAYKLADAIGRSEARALPNIKHLEKVGILQSQRALAVDTYSLTQSQGQLRLLRKALAVYNNERTRYAILEKFINGGIPNGNHQNPEGRNRGEEGPA